LRRRERDGLPARRFYQPPDLSASHRLLVQRLAGSPERVQVPQSGLRADVKALGDVVEGDTVRGVQEDPHLVKATGRGVPGCADRHVVSPRYSEETQFVLGRS